MGENMWHTHTHIVHSTTARVTTSTAGAGEVGGVVTVVEALTSKTATTTESTPLTVWEYIGSNRPDRRF